MQYIKFRFLKILTVADLRLFLLTISVLNGFPLAIFLVQTASYNYFCLICGFYVLAGRNARLQTYLVIYIVVIVILIEVLVASP